MAFPPLPAERALKTRACLRVSRIPPQRDPEAGEVEEGVVGGEQIVMTNQQAAELPQPGVGSFHDPPSLVTSQLTSIFVPSFPVVAAVRCDQVDASLWQPLAQAVGAVPFVGDHALGKSNFCRRGTFQPNSQRNTFAVCQYHPLRPLAALGFTDCE